MTCTVAPRAWAPTASPMRSGSPISVTGQGGFTLLALLFVIAGLGVALAALGTAWETALRREKEAELLFVGDQYRRALESYHQASPGQDKHYPTRLKDLLADPRFPNTVRHLRRLYRDPLGGSEEWGLVKDGEEIVAIHSLSTDPPLKTEGFPKTYEAFNGAGAYRDWVFTAARGADQTADKAPQTPAPQPVFD